MIMIFYLMQHFLLNILIGYQVCLLCHFMMRSDTVNFKKMWENTCYYFFS